LYPSAILQISVIFFIFHFSFFILHFPPFRTSHLSCVLYSCLFCSYSSFFRISTSFPIFSISFFHINSSIFFFNYFSTFLVSYHFFYLAHFLSISVTVLIAVMTALDQHTDGALTNEFATTMMGFMIEELDGNVF
jgi:hypothetical protein